MTSKKIIKYDKGIIAFIDILGFKQIVKESETDYSKLEAINSALTFLKARENNKDWDLSFIEIEESAQKKELKNFDISSKLKCTCFSDSIVVSVIVDDDSIINEIVSTLVTNLSFFGLSLMLEGVLLRGGVTVGNIIHTDNGIVMGQGLIDAYQLEKTVAKYPRIIFSDRLLKKLKYPVNAKSDRYPYHQYIERYDDGCVGFHQMKFFEVLQSWVGMSPEKLTKGLQIIRGIIVDGLDCTFESIDVHQKYLWMKERYDELAIIKDVKMKIYGFNDNLRSGNIHYVNSDLVNNKGK